MVEIGWTADKMIFLNTGKNQYLVETPKAGSKAVEDFLKDPDHFDEKYRNCLNPAFSPILGSGGVSRSDLGTDEETEGSDPVKGEYPPDSDPDAVDTGTQGTGPTIATDTATEGGGPDAEEAA